MLIGLKNTVSRYGWITMALHWLMAIVIIGLIILGLWMVALPISLKKLKFYGWHKEWGILILFLFCLRILWIVTNVTPRLADTIPLWQKFAAHAAHYAMYVFMVALPITGWMISSAAALPVSFFGLFVLPDLIGPNEHNRLLLAQIHQWLSYGLIAAILGHTGAALQHHFLYKDDTLRRMLP